MKKLILLLLLFSISILGYSQNAVEQTAANVADVKEAVDAVKQATTQVNPTVVYFTEKLQELAKSLKVPAEHVYSVLVKQQIVFSWTLTTINIIVLLLVIGLWIALLLDKKNQDEWWGVPVFFTVAFIALFAGTIHLIVSGFMNPEYGAIKEIMQLF